MYACTKTHKSASTAKLCDSSFIIRAIHRRLDTISGTSIRSLCELMQSILIQTDCLEPVQEYTFQVFELILMVGKRVTRLL